MWRLLEVEPRCTEPTGVLIVGEAGVGKTRLLNEVLAEARQKGIVGRLVRANASARPIPFGCLAGVLDQGPDDGAPPGAPQERFHQLVAALVAELAARPQRMLAVDDLSHLDDASAAALHQALLASGGALLATACDGEALPAVFDACWRRGSLHVMRLAPLSDEAVLALILAALGRPPAPDAAERLLRLAGGNPLYLRELLAAAAEAGALRQRGGRWHLDVSFEPNATLRSLVARRLGVLAPAVRRVGELVALAEPLQLDQLAALVESSALAAAVERGLVTIELTADSSLLRCAHGLVAEVLLSDLPPARRQRLSAELRHDPATTGRPSGGSAVFSLERRGKHWRVAYGGQEAMLRDLAGLAHLARLVEHAGEDIAAVDLLGPGAPSPRPRQALVDERALAAYRRRAAELVGELGHARHIGDRDAFERLEAEADAVEAELRRVVRRGGSSRAFADHAERARTAVRKAIIRAVEEIATVHPAAAAQLRASLSTGAWCRYDPPDAGEDSRAVVPGARRCPEVAHPAARSTG